MCKYMGITGLCTPTPVTFLFLALARVGQRMLKLDILPLVETLLIFCCQELLHAWVPPRVGWGGLGVPKAEGLVLVLPCAPVPSLSCPYQHWCKAKLQKKCKNTQCKSLHFLGVFQQYFSFSVNCIYWNQSNLLHSSLIRQPLISTFEWVLNQTPAN